MEKTIIAIFCYRRASKLKRCVEALLKNPECSSMDLIFFCDGYKGDHDKEGVLQSRTYIDSLSGFRNIYKQYRTINVSTGPNFQEGLLYLCQHYDQFIIIEDDLIVSPNYIRFMLDSLDMYRHQPSIFTVSGYCFPIKPGRYLYDSFVHSRFCCYGWASWSDRIREVIWDKSVLYHIMHDSPRFKRRLDTEGMDLYRTLNKQIHGRISTWDIQMQVHVSENGLKVIYPVVSKTYNIGFDEESTNTFGVDYLKTKPDSGVKRKFRLCDSHLESAELQRQMKKPYSFQSLAIRKLKNTMIKLTDSTKKAG